MMKFEIITTVIGLILSVVGIVVGAIGGKQIYMANKNKIKNSATNNSGTFAPISIAGNNLNIYLPEKDYERKNIIDIIQLANEDERSCSKQITCPKKDWILHFFESIKNVSNEDIKIIWSKLLVKEMAKPNSVSYRTLSVLKSVSEKEARLFDKLHRCIFKNSNGYFSTQEFLYKQGFEYADLLLLKEAGLINMEFGLEINYKPDREKSIVTYNSSRILFILPSKLKRLSQIILLTNSGAQLYDALNYDTSIEQFEIFSSWLISKHPNCFELWNAKVIFNADGTFSYRLFSKIK